MDPISALGAVSSAIGIASFALDLSVGLFKLASQVRSAKDSLKGVGETVKSMAYALEEVEQLLRKEEQYVRRGIGLRMFSAKGLARVKETTDQCLVVLWKIEAAAVGCEEPEEFELAARLATRMRASPQQRETIVLDSRITNPSPGVWDRVVFAVSASEKLAECSKQLQYHQTSLILIFNVVTLTYLRNQSSLTDEDRRALERVKEDLYRPLKNYREAAKAVLDGVKPLDEKADSPPQHTSKPNAQRPVDLSTPFGVPFGVANLGFFVEHPGIAKSPNPQKKPFFKRFSSTSTTLGSGPTRDIGSEPPLNGNNTEKCHDRSIIDVELDESSDSRRQSPHDEQLAPTLGSTPALPIPGSSSNQMPSMDREASATSLKVYSLQKHGDWRQEPLSHAEILQRLAKLDLDPLGALDKKLSLSWKQQTRIDDIHGMVNNKEANQKDYVWNLRALELKNKRLAGLSLGRSWGLLAIIVYLEREAQKYEIPMHGSEVWGGGLRSAHFEPREASVTHCAEQDAVKHGECVELPGDTSQAGDLHSVPASTDLGGMSPYTYTHIHQYKDTCPPDTSPAPPPPMAQLPPPPPRPPMAMWSRAPTFTNPPPPPLSLPSEVRETRTVIRDTSPARSCMTTTSDRGDLRPEIRDLARRHHGEREIIKAERLSSGELLLYEEKIEKIEEPRRRVRIEKDKKARGRADRRTPRVDSSSPMLESRTEATTSSRPTLCVACWSKQLECDGKTPCSRCLSEDHGFMCRAISMMDLNQDTVMEVEISSMDRASVVKPMSLSPGSASPTFNAFKIKRQAHRVSRKNSSLASDKWNPFRHVWSKGHSRSHTWDAEAQRGHRDEEDAVDNEDPDGPGHKVEKLPPRPTTASRRATPSETSNTIKAQLQEEELSSGNPSDSSQGKRESVITTQDQSTLAEDSKTSPLIGTGPRPARRRSSDDSIHFSPTTVSVLRESYKDEDESDRRSITEYEQWQRGDLEYGRLFFGPDGGRSNIEPSRMSIDPEPSGRSSSPGPDDSSAPSALSMGSRCRPIMRRGQDDAVLIESIGDARDYDVARATGLRALPVDEEDTSSSGGNGHPDEIMAPESELDDDLIKQLMLLLTPARADLRAEVAALQTVPPFISKEPN